VRVAHASLRVDEVGGGQEAGFPCARGRGVRVEQHREIHRHLGPEFLDARDGLAQVHGEHFERPALERLSQPADRRHLVAARRAPGGPEIHQHDLAPVVREPVLASAEVLQPQLGRRPRPLLEFGSGRRLGKRAGGGEHQNAH